MWIVVTYLGAEGEDSYDGYECEIKDGLLTLKRDRVTVVSPLASIRSIRFEREAAPDV